MNKRKKNILHICCLCSIVLSLILMFFAFRRMEQAYFADELPDMTAWYSADDSSGEVFYDGSWYSENPDIIKFLVIGVDRFADAESNVDSEQADFLAVILLNNAENNIQLIQIDRDTMTDMRTYDAFGKSAGTENAQIALSHAYGETEAQRLENTQFAVENLLYGIEIDYCLSFTMDAVPVMNDFVGGVTVEINDDFSGVDSTLVQGTTMTLYGEQALSFVRARKGMEQQTNENRILRQEQYLQAFMGSFVDCVGRETNFAAKLLNAMSDYMECSAGSKELLQIYDAFSSFAFENIVQLPGEHEVGRQFTEFHVDETELRNMVVDLFYTKQ